jgi:hypothetical protein
MAKEKKSSDKPTPKKKSAAKKTPAKETVVTTNPVAEKIAATPPPAPPHLSAAPLRTAPPSPADLYDEIRRRAYEFYCERGGEHGSHEADWHRAEAEVRSKYKS